MYSTRTVSQIILILLAIAVGIVIFSYTELRRNPTNETIIIKPLPPDVDAVLGLYHFSENVGDRHVEITGKKAVQRGRLIMGFRSNVAKAVFLDDVKGKITSGADTLAFSASRGEWGLTGSSPLVLEKNVTMKIKGRNLTGITQATIRLDSGLVEVFDGERREYRLK